MRQLLLTIVIAIAILTACVKETKLPGSETNSAQISNAGKTTPPSILQWQQTYGSTADDVGNSIAINSTNDAYYVASNTSGNNGNVFGNNGGMDGWVLKIGLDKTLLWQKPIGGSDGDQANAIVGTADGGCLIAGYTTSNDKDISGN